MDDFVRFKRAREKSAPGRSEPLYKAWNVNDPGLFVDRTKWTQGYFISDYFGMLPETGLHDTMMEAWYEFYQKWIERGLWLSEI